MLLVIQLLYSHNLNNFCNKSSWSFKQSEKEEVVYLKGLIRFVLFVYLGFFLKGHSMAILEPVDKILCSWDSS